MSKSKAKRARREAKREHQKKATKAAHKVRTAPAAQSQPVAKKHKSNAPAQKLDTKASVPSSSNALPKDRPHSQASQKHAIPFGVYDKVLLVGEGDFSFARSLCVEHGCAEVMATGFDSEEVVGEKYPTFASIAQDLSSLTPPVPMHHSIDATKISTYKALQPSSSSSSSTHPDTDTDIDTGPYDTIAFMFPHTGGLSTDVNRQVRANQNLIVEFFRSCLQLNSTSPSKASTTSSSHSTSTSNPPPPPPSSSHSSLPSSTPSTSSVKPRKQPPPFLKTRGKIIITLFERSPYTLWNPRDLARHVGLKVLESFKFDWADYPGYAHVRTLGHIEGGGAWRGEDRSARMYVFEKVELDQDQGGEREREVEDRGGRARGKKDSGRGVKRSRDGDKEDSESGDE